MQDAPPETGLPQPFVDRVAEQGLDLRADVGQAGAVFDVHHERKSFDQPAVSSLAAPQPRAGDADADGDQRERRKAPDDEGRRDVDAVQRRREQEDAKRDRRDDQAERGARLEGEECDPGQEHGGAHRLLTADEGHRKGRDERSERDEQDASAMAEDATDQAACRHSRNIGRG
jgi:hypothetical protein